MKLTKLLICALLSAKVNGLAAVAPEATQAPLEKRHKEVIVNKDYKKAQEAKAKAANGELAEEEEDTPSAWIRTYSSTIVEIVTPTVIAGVTFSAKPPTTTNGLEPWISLNKDGSPKTIRPQLKNGNTKNASPTYGTWFATATTVTYNKEELKAHNMKDDEVFTEVKYIEEDQTEHELNPLIRCTPDKYFKKGLAKDTPSEPFCFPHDNQALKMDKTYFITWYSKYFDENVKDVRVHLSFIKESARQRGMKRDEHDLQSVFNVSKRSSVIEKGGTIQQSSFYKSDWIENKKGYYPITIDENWFGPKEYIKKVLISLQPDNIEEDDFNLLDKSIVIEIAKGVKVRKEHNTDLKKLEEKWRNQHLDYEIEEGINYEKYIAMMTMPTIVAIAALCMYFFVMLNKSSTDLSHLKKRKFAGKNTKHRRILFKGKNSGYNELPQYNDNIELTKTD